MALVTGVAVEFRRDGVAQPAPGIRHIPHTDSPSAEPLIPTVPATYSYHANDPASNPALPRAPAHGQQEGLRVVPSAAERLKAGQVRCPRCDKLLAEHLHGSLIIVCPRCKERVTTTR